MPVVVLLSEECVGDNLGSEKQRALLRRSGPVARQSAATNSSLNKPSVNPAKRADGMSIPNGRWGGGEVRWERRLFCRRRRRRRALRGGRRWIPVVALFVLATAAPRAKSNELPRPVLPSPNADARDVILVDHSTSRRAAFMLLLVRLRRVDRNKFVREQARTVHALSRGMGDGGWVSERLLLR